MPAMSLRAWLSIAAVLAALAAGLYLIHLGGDARENKIMAKSAKKERIVEDKKDEIRSRNYDRRDVVDRLHSGTF